MRYLNHKQEADLWNLYHAAKVLYKDSYNRYLYASKHFSRKYPNISSALAYKILTRNQQYLSDGRLV